MSKNIIVDLDGTLLHGDPAEIPVEGQSGSSYMSRAALTLFQQLSEFAPIIIATGRNARSAHRLVSQMPDVRFAGFVLENGLIARTSILAEELPPPPWQGIADALSDWRHLPNYEQCLGIIPPKSLPDAEAVLQRLIDEIGPSGIIYRERHKLFVQPHRTDKQQGLTRLGVKPWLTLGNDINDLEMMEASQHVITLRDAHPDILALVERKGGYISPQGGHAATRDMLTQALEHLQRD